MPSTPDFARAAALEFERERLVSAIFDAYGDEATVSRLRAKLSTLSDELASLRMPQLADAA